MNKKESVALSSVFASLILTLLKLVVGLATSSIGILSEAAHSLLDLGAVVLTFFAVRVGDKEAVVVLPQYIWSHINNFYLLENFIFVNKVCNFFADENYT